METMLQDSALIIVQQAVMAILTQIYAYLSATAVPSHRLSHLQEA
jgi:hypothetical protein